MNRERYADIEDLYKRREFINSILTDNPDNMEKSGAECLKDKWKAELKRINREIDRRTEV